MTRRDAARAGWRCPDCGRLFQQRTREHSCDVHSIRSHLGRGSPEVERVFRALEQALGRLGPYDIVPVKTMVLLRRSRNFGGLSFRRHHLDVAFFLGKRLEHPRVHRVERLSASKFAHHVRVSSCDEVDEELVGWLAQAYRMTGEAYDGLR